MQLEYIYIYTCICIRKCVQIEKGIYNILLIHKYHEIFNLYYYLMKDYNSVHRYIYIYICIYIDKYTYTVHMCMNI
jgi:hypothetical protein